VIVANSSDKKSLELASYYAERRGIPEDNIFAFPMPEQETISGLDFVKTVWDPLTEAFIRSGWMSGAVRSGRDEFTRQNVMVFGNKIGALVLCKGVPLRVEHEGLFYNDSDEKRLPKPFRTTRASVDSELALLPLGNYRLAGPMNNPVYDQENPSSLAMDKLVRVSRIDGPSYSAARRMIDSALKAEENGLKGRAYIDIGGPHKNGDRWMEEVATAWGETDFDLDIDRGRPVIKASARFDAPVLYLGWYTRSIAGVWKELDVVVPPGAIAFHIHSFSAKTIRKRNAGWSGPLVERGVAATVGNVFEPYLEGTHNPVLFFDSLVKGQSLAEAAMRSNRFFSWQTILLGDPLYRPFAVPLEEQIQVVSPIDPFAQYVVIREMNRLIREKGEAAAANFGKRKFMETPGFALALKTAALLRNEGRSVEALDLLSPFRYSVTVAPDEIAVVVGIAEEFAALGDTASALRLLEAMANSQGAPLDLQLSVLQKASEVAKTSGEYIKAEEFRKQYELRKPPPPAPKGKK
tara:strand:+ start:41033 stop:42595 length:1563 start_codon:yes stop_codon:yes gene_type:complete